MRYVIALDVGTSGMIATVYSETGELCHSSSEEYHNIFPAPLLVEQEPSTWTNSALSLLKKTADFFKSIGAAPLGIALTSQRSSLIPVDRAGSPLCNAIMWQDKRTIQECRFLEEELGLSWFYRKTGLRINPFFVLPKILWLKKHHAATYRAAHKFLGVQDLLVHHLTGCFITDWTQASRTMLMNLSAFDWDPELLDLAGIGTDRLCELRPPGSLAGGLLPGVADIVGLPSGLPVAISGGDQQNAAAALGVIKEGIAEANTGTGSFVLSYANAPVFDPNCRIVCQAAAIPGKWVAEAAIFNTGSIYRWFKERFCPDFAGAASAYALMNGEATTSPVGANGVMLLPHFEGSAAPYWNPLSKGMFFNLSLGSRRADMIRAIMEGISMEIADNLSLIQDLAGPLEEVRVAGGMTRSDLFCEIQANTFNKKVFRCGNSEQSSLGASIVSAPALGLHPDTHQAFERMSPKSYDLFEPEAEAASRYSELLRRKKSLYYALEDSDVFSDFAMQV